MKWNMWAQKEEGVFYHIGEKWWVELHGATHLIVPVLVEESEEGTYYGWLEKVKKKPSMIYSRKVLFEMCFPYGYKVEEEKGRGRMIQLSIQQREEIE